MEAVSPGKQSITPHARSLLRKYSKLLVPVAKRQTLKSTAMLLLAAFSFLFLTAHLIDPVHGQFGTPSVTDTTTRAPVPQDGETHATGFTNQFYQVYHYYGSRLLEHGTDDQGPFSVFNWTQGATVDYDDPERQGQIFIVDEAFHVVLHLPIETTYVKWPSLYSILTNNQDVILEYDVVAGVYGKAGYFDGSLSKSKFNGPRGITFNSAKNRLYVADTKNHAVRQIDCAINCNHPKDAKVSTVVGGPHKPGHLDGPGARARLRYPVSLGVLPGDLGDSDKLFILDNHSRVRLVYKDRIITLADGACRMLRMRMYPSSLIVREVGCHAGWNIHTTVDASIPYFQYRTFCGGHAVTCAARHHPALADTHSKHLLTIEESAELKRQQGLSRRMEEVNAYGDTIDGEKGNITDVPDFNEVGEDLVASLTQDVDNHPYIADGMGFSKPGPMNGVASGGSRQLFGEAAPDSAVDLVLR